MKHSQPFLIQVVMDGQRKMVFWFRREELIPEELTDILIESIESTAEPELENEEYEDHMSDDDGYDGYDDEDVICEDSDYE